MLFTFDPPETGWTLGATNSEIVADPLAPSAPNVLSLGFGGFASRTLSGLAAGQAYEVFIWCNFDDVATVIASSVLVKYNSGTKFLFFKDEAVTGWELRSLGTFLYTPANRVLRFETASWDTGRVLIDSIFIAEDVAKRSRWLAHQRLVTVLRGINGAGGGYHLDLGNRVYTKYIRPVGSTHPALPYICVPLVNSNPRVEHDNTTIKHTWTLPIMAFVAEPNVGAFDSDAIAALYHLGEDVYQAVMKDPTLNGTVAPVSFVSGGIDEAGISPFDGMPYADAIIPIDLSIYLGLDVLGP
jgi:hypothetical protein